MATGIQSTTGSIPLLTRGKLRESETTSIRHAGISCKSDGGFRLGGYMPLRVPDVILVPCHSIWQCALQLQTFQLGYKGMLLTAPLPPSPFAAVSLLLLP